MSDLVNMRKYIGVLGMQDIVLFSITVVGIFTFSMAGISDPKILALISFGIFLFAFCCNILLLSTWRILIDVTEAWWSIRAKQRVRRWLVKALVAATIFSLIGCLWFAVEGLGDGGTLVPVSYWATGSLLILFVATILPLMSSLLLTGGAIKRFNSLREYTANLIKSVPTGDDMELGRMRASVLSEGGLSTTSSRPGPKGFYFAGLTSKPWHESHEFDWMASFEAAHADILAEARSALGAVGHDLQNYDYPGINTSNWKTFQFIRDRIKNEDNLTACPVTAKLLETIPGYPVIREAIFSILEPGGVIPPHRDESNIFLTMHYGVITPQKGFMEVAGIRRPWQAGKSLIFDSSYQHQAINDSDEPRIVLLVDFLNPGLSETERQWIAEAPL